MEGVEWKRTRKLPHKAGMRHRLELHVHGQKTSYSISVYTHRPVDLPMSEVVSWRDCTVLQAHDNYMGVDNHKVVILEDLAMKLMAVMREMQKDTEATKNCLAELRRRIRKTLDMDVHVRRETEDG